MEIKITTNQILKVLQVLSWIIFIGLCIEAGAIAVNTVITIFRGANGAQNFWEAKEYLVALHEFDRGHFFVIAVSMTIVAVLKAIMFYLIVKLFVDKKLDMARPFSTALGTFMVHLAYLSFGIGLFAHAAAKHTVWLTKKGMERADIQALHLESSDVWLFMAVILFVIVHVVKRGIEMQEENELTV